MAIPTRAPPVRAYSEDIDSSHQRRRRPGSSRLVATLSPFHKLSTAQSRRRALSDTTGASDELFHFQSSKSKSVKVFHGEAKGILHGIFSVLLLRFLLALVAVAGTLGIVVLLVLMFKGPHASLMS
uniref:Uncharacterized protein n=1 Tax=Peronospora matthiolae TaxID=2874970 RepID=A0AAV1U3R0_9STRA